MLDESTNLLLTRVGPDTPMGNLLRRYWMPIAGVSELEKHPVKPVRIMGEDLVLFRDLGGNYGLLDRHCPHRRADLSYGYTETCGLRCNYHGWLFENSGKVLEQPFEDVSNPEAHFKNKVRIKSYAVEAKAGLVWAYMGPQPAPLVPNFEPFTWENGFVQIVISAVPCNWLQGQENSIDPVHFEWLHRNWSLRILGKTGPYSPRHVKLAFEEFDYGFVYRRITEDTDENDPLWKIGRVCLWPNALFTGFHFEWRVPVDDENLLSITWQFARVPRDREPYVQGVIPTWHAPIRDDLTGKMISNYVLNQDFITWTGQGTISDRQHEHLGSSDRGVIMMRKRLLDDLDAIEHGREPKAIVRDPAVNDQGLPLPIATRRELVEGLTREELLAHPDFFKFFRHYSVQAGQPEEIRRAYDEAMGFDPSEPAPLSQLAIVLPTAGRAPAGRL